MISKFGRWGWRDLYRLPVALFLSPFVLTNYSLRRQGILPDEWYWADKKIFAWGYVVDYRPFFLKL